MPAAASSTSSGSDPLAELARLIGQNDPFAEYGRATAQPQAAPAALQDAPSFYEAPAAAAALQPPFSPPRPEVDAFDPPSFVRQPFGSAPLEADRHLYQAEGEEQRFAQPYAGGHDDEAYHPADAQPGHEQHDFYEDPPRSNRRKSIMVVAGVFALAAMGSAGAFGYRAYFHGGASSAPPPVIKAEASPSKIVPANKDNPSKQITDRVTAPAQSEKLVSREEKPIEVKDVAAAAAFPPGQNAAGAATPAPGSGVVSPDAKRIRTIAIRPDQATAADSMPTVTQAATPPVPQPRETASAPARPTAAATPQPQPQLQQQQQAPARVASTAPTAIVPETVTPTRRPAAAHPAPAAHQPQAAAPSNAPLSLSPDAPAPVRAASARAAAPAARTAAVTPTQTAPAAVGGGGSYAVQVSSQRSEAEAQAAFRSQQSKYPDQLGGKQPLIHKVDLGAKGTFYRVMIGPFATGGEASKLCGSLKAAGGQCIVQRN